MPSNEENLRSGDEELEFFVWVDVQSFKATHNLTITGQFFSAPQPTNGPNLPLVPNMNAGFLSPFTVGVMRSYVAEYNLELARFYRFQRYPSRLSSIYLLPTQKEAEKYLQQHPEHVAGRILKRARSKGQYTLSEHDSSWIDFMRLPHVLEQEELAKVSDAYWRGVNTEACLLTTALGKPWSSPSIREILYLGHIEFPDRSLETSPTT